MTDKRFEVVMNEFDEVEYISDIIDCEDRDFAEFMDFVETVCKENEQLRTKNNAYIQDIEVFKEENTHLKLENEQLKLLIKKVLETTPIEHSLALDLKNSIRELYK